MAIFTTGLENFIKESGERRVALLLMFLDESVYCGVLHNLLKFKSYFVLPEGSVCGDVVGPSTTNLPSFKIFM